MGLQTKETRLIELTAELVRLSEETARISREIQELLGQHVNGQQAGDCNETPQEGRQKDISASMQISAPDRKAETEEAGAEEAVLNPLVLEFMDLPDLRGKFEFLRSMDCSTLRDSDVDTMAVVIDVTLPDGSIEDRVEDLMACIHRLLQYQNYRR